MTRAPAPPRLGLLVLALCLAALAGCSHSSGRDNVATVWGTVYFNGEPLPGGTIHFVRTPKDKTSLWIRGDGTYGGEVPVGPAKVAVETESVKYTDRDRMFKKWRERNPELARKKQQKLDVPLAAPRMVYTPIPDRYSDPEKSGLSFDVTGGAMRQDFRLEGPAGKESP